MIPRLGNQIFDGLKPLVTFFTILKPLVLVMWSSFKILIGSRAHVLMIDNNLNI